MPCSKRPVEDSDICDRCRSKISRIEERDEPITLRSNGPVEDDSGLINHEEEHTEDKSSEDELYSDSGSSDEGDDAGDESPGQRPLLNVQCRISGSIFPIISSIVDALPTNDRNEDIEDTEDDNNESPTNCPRSPILNLLRRRVNGTGSGGNPPSRNCGDPPDGSSDPPRRNSFDDLFRNLFSMGDGGIPPDKVDPTITFDSCGGLDDQIFYLKTRIIHPFLHNDELQKWGGISPVKGIIFHGPPGSGKTLLAKALSNELSKLEGKKFNFYCRKGPEMLNKFVGQTEANIRELFETSSKRSPSIVFLDEIDAMCLERNDDIGSGFRNGVVTQLLASIDNLERGRVLVIGATNRIEALDPAFRRPGRFDKELSFTIPSKPFREKILQIHTSKWANKPSPEEIVAVASLTDGYSGADLENLCREAFMTAYTDKFPTTLRPNLINFRVELHDWKQAVKSIKKSNPNVFGDKKFYGGNMNDDFRLLLGDLENELYQEILPSVKITSEGGYCQQTITLWSEQQANLSAIRTILAPSLLSSTSSLFSTFEFDDRYFIQRTTKNEFDNFFNQIKGTKGHVVLYFPFIDKTIRVAEENDCVQQLYRALTEVLVGKPATLFAISTVPPSDIHQPFSRFLLNGRSNNSIHLRKLKEAEVKKYLTPLFKIPYIKENGNVQALTREGSNRCESQFEGLLNKAVNECKNHSIDDIICFRTAFENTITGTVPKPVEQILNEYETVFKAYTNDRFGRTHHIPGGEFSYYR